ncbi:MAG TPA: hypothetical protein VH186_00840, partial [Chloroflexia bacterium]|nr:hypothetical protein [Chloroflexia bacterium]
MVAPGYGLLDNPYIVAQPLKRGQLTGRDDVLAFVQKVFSHGQQQAILLYGQRRIGKTSILLSIKETLDPDRYFSVYYDMIDSGGRSFGLTLYDLAFQINRVTAKLKPAEFKDGFKAEGADPEKYFQYEFLPRIWESLPGGQQVVLLLDEIDTLNPFQNIELLKEEDSTSLLVFQFIRRLLRDEPRLLLVGVMGRSPSYLPENARLAFLDAAHLRVTYLERNFADSVVRLAENRGLVNFKEGSIEAILNLSGGHPYFTQLICSEAFNFAFEHPSGLDNLIPQITAEMIEASLPEAINKGRQILEYIWSKLSLTEKLVITLAALSAGAPSWTFSKADIVNLLVSENIPVKMTTIPEALEELMDEDYIQLDPGGEFYSFRVDLLRRWLLREKSLSKVLREVEEFDPVANILFEHAQQAEVSGDPAQARSDYQDAIRRNPEHIRARIGLGQLLLRQAQASQPPDLDLMREAVEVLREAQRRNPALSGGDLAQGLVLLANNAASNDEAFGYYSEILTILPNDGMAIERIEQLADKLMERGELEKAREYYRQAGNQFKTQEVEKTITRLNRIATLTKQGELDFDNKQWEQAAATYGELCMLEPEKQLWRERLSFARNQVRLAELYAEALEASSSGNPSFAVTRLREIIETDPGYRDSRQLLKKATRLAENQRRASTPSSTTRSWVWMGLASVVLLLAAGTTAVFLFGIGKAAITTATPVALASPTVVVPSVTATLGPNTVTATAPATATPVLTSQPITPLPPVLIPSPTALPPTPTAIPIDTSFSEVTSVNYAPDGTTIAAGFKNGDLKLLDVKDGHVIRQFVGHNASVNSVSFSPDGKTLASGSSDGSIRLWEVTSGKSKQHLVPATNNSSSGDTIVAELNGAVATVAFAPDGRLFAGTSSGVALIFNTQPVQPVKVLSTGGASVNAVAYSKDGKLLGYASNDGSVKLYNQQYNPLQPQPKKFSSSINALVFAPDDKAVAVGGNDGKITLFDPLTYKNTHTFTNQGLNPGQVSSIAALAYSPDSSRLVSGGSDGSINLWDLATGANPVNFVQGHSGSVNSLGFSPDGKRFVSGSSDKTIKEWDATLDNLNAQLKVVRQLNGLNTPVYELAFSPDGATIATATGETTVRLWDPATGNEKYNLSGSSAAVFSLAFAPDGKTLAAGAKDGSVKIWELQSRQVVIDKSFSGAIAALAFSPDGNSLLVGTDGGAAALLNLQNGTSKALSKGGSSINAVAYAPDNRLVAFGASDGSVIIYNVQTFAAPFKVLPG